MFLAPSSRPWLWLDHLLRLAYRVERLTAQKAKGDTGLAQARATSEGALGYLGGSLVAYVGTQAGHEHEGVSQVGFHPLPVGDDAARAVGVKARDGIGEELRTLQEVVGYHGHEEYIYSDYWKNKR